MAAGKINLQKASGGITAITGVDGAGNTQLVLPESGIVATTAGATETSTGLVELATTAETQAGTDDLRAITALKLFNSLKGSNQSLTVSGYQKLHGGLIIQWGLITNNNIGANSTAYVNYNIAFPSGVGYTAIQVQSATVNSGIFAPFITIPGDGTALSRFQIYNTDSDSALSAYRWFAIGY